MQRNKISFKGQKIYIGIDVHKKIWEVFCLTESGANTRHSQNASAKELATYLHRRFPEGEYCAVYESGFTGFSTYYALEEVDIDCIVVNAADVPTTQYQTIMKTDNICIRCKKPMETITAEMHAICYGQNFYACEHCGMLYSIYRPEFVVYKSLWVLGKQSLGQLG